MWTDAARERYKDDGRRTPSDLTDAEWRTIEPVLRSCATLKVDLRERVNACLYLKKAGCPWRYLPREFGPWQSVRSWHDRFRSDGLWSDIAILLTRAVRAQQGRAAEPTTAILDSQSVASVPQSRRGHARGRWQQAGARHRAPRADPLAGLRAGRARDHGQRARHAAVGALLDRATQDGWSIEHAKVDGIHVGPRMAQAAQEHDLDVQVTTRETGVKGLPPLAPRWRIEATFGTLSNRWHRLTRNLEQSPAAAEDPVSIANCPRLLCAYHRPEYRIA
jgi:putative transposase